MNGPLVSIIVPVYNAAAGLAKCIETARRQTYGNIELLLVNDGSADSSPHICRMYARVDSRIRITPAFQPRAMMRCAPRAATISSLWIPTITLLPTPPNSLCALPRACGATW